MFVVKMWSKYGGLPRLYLISGGAVKIRATDLRTSSFPANGHLLVRIERKIPRHIKITITFTPSHIVFYRLVINFVNLRIILFSVRNESSAFRFSPSGPPGRFWYLIVFFFLIYSSRHIHFRHPCHKLAFHPHYLRRKWKKMGVCHKFWKFSFPMKGAGRGYWEPNLLLYLHFI